MNEAALGAFALALVATFAAVPPLLRRAPPWRALGDGAMLGILVLARCVAPHPLAAFDAAVLGGVALHLAVAARFAARPAVLAIADVAGAALLVATHSGIDLAALRDGPFNAVATVAFVTIAGLGARALVSDDAPHRSTGTLALTALGLASLALGTAQASVLAVAVPLAGGLVALHALLLPPAEAPGVARYVPALAFALAASTLEGRFSDVSRWGALAAPLLWAVPAIGLLHRCAGIAGPGLGPVLGAQLAIVALATTATALEDPWAPSALGAAALAGTALALSRRPAPV